MATDPASADREARSREIRAELDALLGGADEAFVDAAYRRVLGRAPDPAGGSQCLAQLEDGASRLAILEGLLRSDEAAPRARALAGLIGAVAGARHSRATWLRPAAETYEQLTAHADESFVRGAYLAVLGREADPGGLANYLAQVRAGAPKAAILAQLLDSPEGRGHLGATRDAGSRAILGRITSEARRLAWSRIPVLGPLLARLAGWERDDGPSRRLRRLENLLARVAGEVLGDDGAAPVAGAVPPPAAGAEPGGEPQERAVVARPAADPAASLLTLPTLSTRRPARATRAAP